MTEIKFDFLSWRRRVVIAAVLGIFFAVTPLGVFAESLSLIHI